MSDAGALLISRVAQAQAEMEGMKTLNTERERNGLALAYDESAFLRIKEDIDNAIGEASRSRGWELNPKE